MSENSQTDPPENAPRADIAALYAIHAIGLRRFVVGVLKDQEAAADVVQATFVKAVQAAGEIPPEAIKSWLYRVAFNEAITRKRRDQVDRKASQRLREGSHDRDSTGPEEVAIRAENVAQLREALSRLSPQEQRVVLARMSDQKTFAQIALETGLPLGTVLTQMRRALEKLKRALQSKE